MSSLRAWRKTLLRFGLVSIPVGLVPAKDGDAAKLSRHRFDSASRTRVSQAWTSDGGESIAAETFLAFENADGTPLEVETPDDDGAPKEIALEAFVSEGAVSPLFYDSAYLVFPSDGGAGSLSAVAAVLKSEPFAMFAGSARFTDRTRSVVIRYDAFAGGLVLHTLTYGADIRAASFRIAADMLAEPDAATMAQAESLVSALPSEFEPRFYDPLAAMISAAVREASPDGAELTPPDVSAGDVLDSLRADVKRRAKTKPSKPKTESKSKTKTKPRG